MNVQPIDIAILLISTAACIYCIVLSRRLRALQNTKNGLGATIMAFSESVSKMSAVTKDTRVHAGELATRLAGLIEEARQACAEIEQSSDAIRSRQESAIERVNDACAELNALMRKVIDESETRMGEMTRLSKQVQILTESTTTDILEAIHRAAAFQPQSQNPMVEHNDVR